MALIALVGFWFLMKKTTLGFEIKAVGLNPFASRYAAVEAIEKPIAVKINGVASLIVSPIPFIFSWKS